jgi:hypothetical protein
MQLLLLVGLDHLHLHHLLLRVRLNYLLLHLLLLHHLILHYLLLLLNLNCLLLLLYLHLGVKCIISRVCKLQHARISFTLNFCFKLLVLLPHFYPDLI